MSGALDLAVRALVVLILAWLAVALLRKQPASLRAFVWTVAFGGVLALPLLAWLMPAWRIALWQEPVAVHVVNLRSEAPPRTFPVVISPDDAPRLPISQVFVPGTGASTPVPPAAPAHPVDWRGIALLMAALVTLLLLARIAASHMRMSRLLARTAPAGEDWMNLVEEVRAARGIRRSVAARISDAVSVPAIAGVFRPTLILPGEAADWDGALRRAVVLHELAHVARWDALAQLLGQLACAVYWFNPLAWHGARRASALRERASDDEVLRAGMPGPAYAGRLLDLVRGAGSGRHHLATVAMARPSRMRERVLAILDPIARREALTMRTVLAAMVLSSGAVAAIAAAAPGPSETPTRHPAEVTVSETAWVPAPPVRQPQAGSQLCGSELQEHQHQSGSKNGRRMLTLKLSGGGCTVDLEADGRITFNDDFTDVAGLESGGFFRVAVTEGGARRQLHIESRNGSLTRTWRVDGREVPYDAAAQAWFATFLIDLDRRTAIGVDVRLPRLLRAGGVNAVLDETARMTGDYARHAYYTRLAKAAPLSSGDVARVLQQAAKLTRSDYYAHNVVKAFGASGRTEPAARAAITELIERMGSDYYRAESIGALVGSGRPGPAETEFLVRMLPRMTSDHYKVQTLRLLATSTPPSADLQMLLLRATAGVKGDYYAAEVLKALASIAPMAPQARQAFLEAVRGIEGDHYASEVLRMLIRTHRPQPADVAAILRLAPEIQGSHYRGELLKALLEIPDLDERALLGVISAAKPMSDHHETETLTRVLRHGSATDRVRDAVLDAAESLSRHYRNEVRSGAVRRR